MLPVYLLYPLLLAGGGGGAEGGSGWGGGVTGPSTFLAVQSHITKEALKHICDTTKQTAGPWRAWERGGRWEETIWALCGAAPLHCSTAPPHRLPWTTTFPGWILPVLADGDNRLADRKCRHSEVQGEERRLKTVCIHPTQWTAAEGIHWKIVGDPKSWLVQILVDHSHTDTQTTAAENEQVANRCHNKPLLEPGACWVQILTPTRRRTFSS